jgi:DNA mismatch endonuclease (patch repair protein)
MPDVFTKDKRSQVMSLIRSSGNRATELAMIRIFRARRITGWRRGRVVRVATPTGSLRIRPDFVFPARKVAVFVDGEFWHGHPTRCQIPQARRSWWAAKIESNKRRDRRQNRALRVAGWTVVRVWQHELKTPAVLRKLKRGELR